MDIKFSCNRSLMPIFYPDFTKKVVAFLLISLSAGIISSCMVGPNYVSPKVVISPQFKEVEVLKAHYKNWKPIKPQDMQDRGPWWTLFHDPVLNKLEDQLNRYNQNIAQI